MDKCDKCGVEHSIIWTEVRDNKLCDGHYKEYHDLRERILQLFHKEFFKTKSIHITLSKESNG